MVRQRVRIRFGKQALLRWIGHRDLMRCFERLFRRAGLPLGMSQGFHPKPRMTFPTPLAVGIEGSDEVVEVELAESCTADGVLGRLSPHVPAGLTLNSVQVLPERTKKARAHSVSYQVPVPPECRGGMSEKIERLLAGCCPVQRPNRTAPIDLRPLIEELTFRQGVLSMRLRTDAKQGARPREVLGVLGLADLELKGVHLTRFAVRLGP